MQVDTILTEETIINKNETLKIFKREDVMEASLKYFKGDTLAAEVWINKYALKDSAGNIYEKTPDDMHRRIAKELARVESKYENPIDEETIFSLIKDFKFIVPQGSPMSGIGNNFQVVSLSNCFVIGNEIDSDSYGGLFKLDQELVQLQKRRAGVGLDLSFVRPKGSPVKNSALTSTGIVPFMERYSNSTREVAQDGRRGALMESFSIRHPDAEDFIDAKMTQGKVTGANVSMRIHDDFMEAVVGNKSYTQKFPVDSNTPKVTKEVDASKLWKKIIHNAWKSAEPGILFWDTIIKESIPDCYAHLGFKTISTNPCIVGDTLVALADGRDNLTIKQLAEEGNDVPVYCYDENGRVVIRTMRNPRITGYKEKIYKLTIENGHEVRVTGNHKFKLKSGKYVQAKDLKFGDSLEIMTKYEASIKDIFKGANSNSQDYIWINGGIQKGTYSEHRLIAEFNNNSKIVTGQVVHHIDYDAKNNRPENLKIMLREDHDLLHSQDMIGEKNPYHRMTSEWKEKFSESQGELNGKYSGFTEKDIREKALDLTKKLKRRFSVKDWITFAKENGYPQNFSGWREKQFNGGIISLAKWAAKETNYDEYTNLDPRLVKTYYSMLDQGYDAEIVGHEVLITKECECNGCKNKVLINHSKREVSYCSISCHNKMMHSNQTIKTKIRETRTNTEKNRKEIIANKQIKLYSDLTFKLGHSPMRKIWELECKNNDVSFELGRKTSPITSFKTLKELASTYNHKVISVVEDGYENVYNGTVDEFHNFFVGGFEEKTKNNKRKCLYINNLQCGEITLCANDSCRLVAINLYNYVVNPFTKDAYFDMELFKKHAYIAERFMDDIIDLELEKIDKIIEKINSDPETAEIKATELKLWLNIKDKCIQGRRTGLGITAEGDMIAALNLRYGSNESLDVAENIHRQLKLSAYRSSVDMAKERGAFPIFDAGLEKNNPFILRMKAEDPKLYADMMQYGRRNIALLTIAPTGSVSILTQTTSGVEPAFLVSYMRRRKINPQEKNVRVDFVDEVGDSWQEYPVFHHKFEVYLAANGYDVNDIKSYTKAQIEKLIEQSPYYKATSNDVDWVKKVEMQGRIQKHIDHSISVTVNLPNEITEEIVSKVYETGWRSGCKGMTVYRDGSRSGVLVSESAKKEKEVEKIFKDNHAPKRPKRLKGEIMRFQNNLEKWIGVVGLLDGRPYEIFTGKLENGLSELSSSIKECEIVKNRDEDGQSRYDIEYIDQNGEKQIHKGLSHAFNPEFWNYAKLISSVLRHGMPMIYVQALINSLNLNDEHLNTWKNGMARVVKKYIPDGEKGTGKCQSCGGDSLQYIEGCLTCKSCGSSKCG